MLVRKYTQSMIILSVTGLAGTLTACGGGGNDGGNTGGQTSYSVTPSVSGSGGTISPLRAVSVKSGATTSFTVTPNSGYATSVGGTCKGTLSGNTYTTQAITGNCTVVATFAQTTQTASIAACYTVPNAVSFAVDPNNQWPDKNAISKVSVTQGTFNGQAATAYTMYYNPGYPVSSGVTTSNTSITEYWNVTTNNLVRLGGIIKTTQTDTSGGTGTYTGITTDIFSPANSMVTPLNLQPGKSTDYIYTDTASTHVSGPSGSNDQQTVTNYTSRTTFVGFETLTLAGKTFSNVCHLKEQDLVINGVSQPTNTNLFEYWAAPGYGYIKMIQYDSAGSHIIMQYSGPAS